MYYYDNGQVKEEQYYKLGIRDGDWRSYDITGEQVLRVTYSAGREEKIEGGKIDPGHSREQ